MSQGELRGCPTCNGKKIIMGLGMIQQTCPECKGVGWIEVFETKIEEVLKSEVTQEEALGAPKRRGRPAAKKG